MRAALVLALCVAVVTAVPSNPQRIIGGSVTTIAEYPSMVSMLFSWNLNTYWQSCGGIIINNRAILSAAHCFWGDAPVNWRFRVGSTWANSGGTVHNVQSFIIHASYRPPSDDHDIVIVRSASTISYNNAVQAGLIAGSNYNLADNQVVWATGWGRTSQGGSVSEQLRHVQVWTINQATCRTRYATVGDTITDNMLCSGWLDVGGRDQCQGDSGGPLYHNRVVVGVCSWGRGCALPFFPGVNVRVSRYTSWIQYNA